MTFAAKGAVMLLLVHSPFLHAQPVRVDAGSIQTINWEETHSVRLTRRTHSGTAEAGWTCPRNPGVVFRKISSAVVEVTFPRPGYFLLVPSGKGGEGDSARSSAVVNVVKPRSYEDRLSDLVSLMTVTEKIGQLTNQTDAIPRLGIRQYNYWSEALHGVLAAGATCFPQAVAMGSTWDPDLVHRVATAISEEARGLHVLTGKGLTYWSPTVNIARDPRWGRNEESYSEDPYLVSRMAVAFVRGMQGDDPFYLRTVSTPKHFIANNEEERRHTGSSDVDMRSLWEYYLPAFRQTIVEGHAYSIMGAYNELNGVPCNANTFLLTDLLRRTWGFTGYVVSDCGAISDMVQGHRFFGSGAEAAARSILAGCDLDCGDEYRRYLQEALDKGLLEEKDLDKAVRRVLSARFRLGEFDPPGLVPYSAITPDRVDSKEHRDLALEVAQKSIVLLKNNGILPLDTGTVHSIAVIGPNAAEPQLGIYSGWPVVQVSPLDGIRASAAARGISVEYTMGSVVHEGILKPIDPRYFTRVDGTMRTGMQGEYFDNMNLSGKPVVTRIDSMVDFNFGMNAPAAGVPKDRFSVRWRGRIIPPAPIHHIGTSTDDGARLFVDGRMVIDDWTDHGEKQNSAEVDLKAGREYEIEFQTYDNTLGACARLTWDLSMNDSAAVKRIAARNDVVVLVLGTSPALSQEELDRTEIELPQVQRELIRAVSTVNSHIVVVLTGGGPVALAGTEKLADAIVEAWYPGEYGGTAIADVLFGVVNPGGKLPETFYTSTRQLPAMSDYDLINHPRTYMYIDEPVLFPFGHGISYTRFAYSNLRVTPDSLGTSGEITIHVDVQNTGHVKGDEVVQVYVHDVVASVKVPINQLKRFQRITLEPGEKENLAFNIPATELSFYDVGSNALMTEPGRFEIQVGSSSRDIRLRGEITVAAGP